MGHVLAKIRGAKLTDVKQQLDKDAQQHADEGMFLEHLWQNTENADEVLFLFHVRDLEHCRKLTQQRHAEARRLHPEMPLPEMIFLDAFKMPG